MMRSCVASAFSSRATMRPSRITTIRSLIARTSGSSDEIIKIAILCAASSPIKRCTSAFAPISIPRVGSSRINTFGCVSNHLTTLLFADYHPIVRARLALHVSAQCATSECSLAKLPARLDRATSRAARAVRGSTASCFARSSSTSTSRDAADLPAHRTKPCANASRGDLILKGLPSNRTSPESVSNSPNSARPTSVRPAPTNPAKPTISPARTSKVISANFLARDNCLTSSKG